MLFDELEDLPNSPSDFELIGTTIAFMDDAQYELEPFWNGAPSAENVIHTSDMSSVAGTSLRL